MEDLKSQIDTNLIRVAMQDGSYFARAREWYDELYHRPIAERTFFLVILFLCIITIFFSSITYLSMMPLSRTVPYTIYSEDVSEELPLIKPLRGAPMEDVNLSIARFLVANYVKERESYRYDVVKLEWQFNRIRATSGAEEFQRYQQSISPENPGSLINKLGRSGTRIVTIYNLSLNLNPQRSGATVYFSTITSDGKTRQQNNWVANIAFRFPELKVDQNTSEVLQWNAEQNTFEVAEKIAFSVESYTVQELTQ